MSWREETFYRVDTRTCAVLPRPFLVFLWCQILLKSSVEDQKGKDTA